MASIFLSYARNDLVTARRIAAALEQAGHSVWWDHDIHAGSRFSAEIDAALNSAELVIVLWSGSSIRSDWVHDEASAGRDSGRLLPVLIERVQPPLGFRQYQAVDLTGRLRGANALRPLINAIEKRGDALLDFPPTSPRRSFITGVGWRIPALIAAVVIALAGLWFILLHPSGAPSHIIAVAATDGGDQRRSQELARAVATDLGRYRAGPLGSLTILGGGRESGKADYRVEVGVVPGTNLRADVSLYSAKDSRILWTTSAEGPAGKFVDLRQGLVAKLGDVLRCTVDVSHYSRKLRPEVLGLYLNGCGRMSDIIFDSPNQEVTSIFRQVTEQAPDFGPGWASLALVEVQSFPGTPASDRPALRRQVVDHLARATKLDPTLPETIAARAFFHPNDGTNPAHALGVLERGLEQHPDSPLLHYVRCLFLGDVGRRNDSVVAAERATQLNPLSPSFRDAYVSSLAYSGRIEAAYAALEEAEAIWPGSTTLEQARYRLDLRYGDPRGAKRLLLRRGTGDLAPVPMDTAWLAFVDARIDPSPANVEKVLDGFRARYRRDPQDIPGYLQALGTFGRVDEAYEVVKPTETLDSMLESTETLFRPHMRSIRADPRFIALAARLKLLDYWQQSGLWPDFCDEPQLPYDCKAEAAKLKRRA
jgi:hypothetical protein